jgi:hypothetical protein
VLHVSRTVEVGFVVASVAMFVATLLAVPLYFTRISDDHFVRHEDHPLAKRIALNAIGALLVLLGIAMLVLPGQGLLTVIVGLTLLDLPFKKKLLRKLLMNPKVKHALDAMRSRAGRGPLIPPQVPA